MGIRIPPRESLILVISCTNNILALPSQGMPLSRELFDLIKLNHGDYASWALWNEPQEGDLRLSGGMNDAIFENITDEQLSQLKPEFVFVGLNLSIGSVDTLMNFHSVDNHIGKLRYALRNSPFWGAYLTDAIKSYSNPDGNLTMEYIAENPEIETKSIEILRKEINDLNIENPILIAFGRNSFKILNRNLKGEFRIIQITHYSHQIEKPVGENYKNKIMRKLMQELGCNAW